MLSTIIKTIGVGIVSVGAVVSSWFGTSEGVTNRVAGTFQTPDVRALFETTLASRITATDSSMTLTSGTDIDGNTLASSTYAFIIDEGTASEEFVLADCTGTTCTNLTRGLSGTTGTTTVSALRKEHRRGASVKITDASSLLFVMNVFKGRQNIENPLKYSSSISTSSLATDGNNLVNVALLNDTAFGAIPAASQNVSGFVELSTTAEINAGTATGGTGAGLAVTPDTLLTSIYNVQLPSSGQKSALAGLTGTPSATNKYVTQGYQSLNAGETINGATTPVPVYQNSSDFEVYSADANDTAKLKFIGFAYSNSTDGNAINIQTEGIIGGFTGLTRGVPYYVQDAVGTIGTTPGTYSVLVGWAISTTEIMIQKGARRSQGTFSVGTSSGSTALTFGFRPTKVKITAVAAESSFYASLDMVWTPQNSSSVSALYNEASVGVTAENVYRLYDNSTSASNYMTFSVGSVTGTGVTITWTETGTFNPPAGTALIWEAEGDI